MKSPDKCPCILYTPIIRQAGSGPRHPVTSDGLKTGAFNDFSERFNKVLKQGQAEGIFGELELEHKRNDDVEESKSIKIIQELLASFNKLMPEHEKKIK